MTPAPQQLSLLIVDDQKLFLEGLFMILNQEPFVYRLFTASNGREAQVVVEQEWVDLVITDLNMPEVDGFHLVRNLRKKSTSIKIIAVSVRDDLYSITEAIKLGVNSFLNKICEKETLLQAVRQVLQGENYFPPNILQRLTSGCTGNDTVTQGCLSAREKDVLKLICAEKTTFEIADMLCISDQTVVSHRKNILCKLGVKNTAGAVYCAIKNGIID
jgi:DNA-binding NarL/FixJ family response regulator